MGDRIGIRFVDGLGNESVIIHSHWMGRSLLKELQLFAMDNKEYLEKSCSVEGVCARFLMWYGIKHGISDDLDVQNDDGDCEDNGVFELNIDTGLIA